MSAPSTWRSALAILRKDLRAELRSRVAINALLLFAVTTVVLVSFRLGPLALSREARAVTTIAVLLWIAIFFAAMSGLARSFVVEEETGTAALLRLSAAPGAVFVGKLLFNLVLLTVLEGLVVVLFAGFMNLRVPSPGMFAVALAAGGIGLAIATTIVAALVSRASVRGALFTVLAFPLLLPLLVVAVGATELALAGAPWSKAWPEFRLLAAYALALLAVSALLFEQVWEG